VVLLELLLITGARLGDLLGLEWADVSDEGIGFLNTKNGKVRLVEMTRACARSLHHCRVRRSGSLPV
jgi:integrase